MKLDKIRFARLVQFIMELRPENWVDVEQLDGLIEIDVVASEPEPFRVINVGEVDLLIKHMVTGISKIETIRAYRNLTRVTLKDAKDAIERYWVSRQPD